jgi:hypothetical protein
MNKRANRRLSATGGRRGASSDASTHNFLERLLVFCMQSERRAPRESGVRFLVSPPPADRSVCILFRIDFPAGDDPLFTDEPTIRPDYLVMYCKADSCIFTIVEMKGTTRQGLKYGIQQIKSFRDRLRTELRDRLPGRFFNRITIQGILLSPQNSQAPLGELRLEQKRGLVILPLQYHHTAELYHYLGSRLLRSNQHAHSTLSSSVKLPNSRILIIVFNFIRSAHRVTGLAGLG